MIKHLSFCVNRDSHPDRPGPVQAVPPKLKFGSVTTAIELLELILAGDKREGAGMLADERVRRKAI